jgi:hypothetical protein
MDASSIAAVPCDDAVLPVDQHGLGPAELPDARCNLRNLGIGVGARVAGGRHRTIIDRRRKIKDLTIRTRRLAHQRQVA